MKNNNLKSFIDNRTEKKIEFLIESSRTFDMFYSKLRPLEKKVVEYVMASGGFIAGGCPRYVSDTIELTGDFTDTDMDAYRQFGDIDFFFADKKDADTVISQLGHRRCYPVLSVENDDNISLTPSAGGFAYNIKLHEDRNFIVKLHKKMAHIPPIKMQLVVCDFNKPKATLSRFDFLNSMLAFVKIDEQIKTIIPAKWRENEKTNTLKVVDWSSPLTLSRIVKYMKKYGYKHVAIDDTCTSDDIMNTLTKTFELLPNSDERARRRSCVPQQDCEGNITFTRENFCSQIVNFLDRAGHFFDEELTVFMMALCMSAGIANENSSQLLLKNITKKRNDSKFVCSKEVETWKKKRDEAIKFATEQEDNYGWKDF